MNYQKAEKSGKKRQYSMEEIKERLRGCLGEYLRSRGDDLRKNIRCIHPEKHKHGDAKPSAHYYANSEAVYCHVCQKNYDIFDIIGVDYGISDFPGQIRKGCELFNLEYPGREPQAGTAAPEPEKKHDFRDAIEQANAAALASQEALEYYAGRGFDAEAVKRYKLGYMPFNAFVKDPALQVQGWDKYRYIIPYPGGEYFAARSDAATDEKDKYRYPRGMEKQVFYLPRNDTYKDFPVVIVEGQLDAIAVNLCGMPAAATGGSGAGKLTEWAKANAIREAIIATDADEAGETSGAKDEAALQEAGVFTYRADSSRLYGRFKDAAAARKDPAQYEAMLKGFADADAQLQEKEAEAERERQKNTGTGIIDTFLETVQSRRYEPIKTGFLPFDDLTGGLTRQGLIMLAAAPGTGKTTITAQLFEGMAQRGAQVLFINLEMSREQLIARSLCRYAWEADGIDLPANRILQGYSWDGETRERVYHAADGYKRDIAGNMMYFDREKIGAQLGDIVAFIEREAAHAEAQGKPAPLVVIDYLHIIESTDANGRAEDIAATIKRSVTELKAFAIRHNTVVFAIIATNRESNKAGRMALESGRDTSNIEYSADMFIGLNYTAWENGEDTTIEEEKNRTGAGGRSCRRLTMKLLKNRMGADGTARRIVFDAEHGIAREEA